jgi:hypothetical protein
MANPIFPCSCAFLNKSPASHGFRSFVLAIYQLRYAA